MVKWYLLIIIIIIIIIIKYIGNNFLITFVVIYKNYEYINRIKENGIETKNI